MVCKTINIIICLVFIFYYLFLQKYVISKFFCKKSRSEYILIYWIDYIITVLVLVLISIFFSINLYINDKSEENNIEKILTIIFDEYFPFFFASNFIMDIILSLDLLLKIKKIKINKGKKFHIAYMNKFIKKINIMSHYRVIPHLIIMALIYIFDSIVIFLIEFKMKDHKSLLINLYQIILFILTLGIIIFLSKQNKGLIGHQVFFKNNIVETIYNNNKVKLIACSEHLMYKYICDLILIIPSFVQIFYKSDSDSNLTYKFTYFYSTMFAGFIYLFSFGVMMLSVEGTNFSMLPCILKFLFCLKNFNFYFGDGKKLISKILDSDDTNIYNYNIYFNQSKLFNKEEEIINKLNGINDYSGDQSTINSLIGKSDTKSYNTIKQNISDSKTQSDLLDEKIRELEKERMKKEKEYSPCNFFIIFKLMYLYYNSNIKVFQNIKKASEENGFFNEISSTKNRMTRKTFGRISNVNSNDSSDKRITIANMKEKLNRVSKVEIEQLSSYKKYNLKDVMSNIQEYSMKTFFIKYLSKNLNKNKDKNINIISNISNRKETEIELNNKFSLPPEVIKDKSTIFNASNNNDLSNTNSNINMNMNSLSSLYNDNNIDIPLYEFKIESLMNTVLLDLFPYYEIDVKDIINSLNVCNNMNLFYSFFKNKNSDKNYNSYYTSDSFLTFEIYEKNFLSYNQLKSFMINYKKYFLEKISNFSYTFLPLIVGIFNISYLSYDKVIILYRNPLAFTPNVSFHYWLKFFFSQEFDKLETSTNTNDVVDINEIEVINNIKLSNEEYSDTINILDEDINFLISSSFNLDFKLNLFILNDVNKLNSLEDSLLNKDKNEELNNGKNNITENTNLMNMIRNTECFPGNNAFDPFNFKKKIFGSEMISLLENVYMSDLSSNNYIFKIYFTEIFKKSDNDKKSNNISNNENRNSAKLSGTNLFGNPEDSEIKENNQKLCKFLKNKILRKIGKSNNIFEEEYHD